MISKEAFSIPSYQGFVAEQISLYAKNFNPAYNIVASGVFSLAQEFKNMPVWALSFAEKPVQVNKEDTIALHIVDENELVDFEVPRQFKEIIVEREIINDANADEALVERVYFLGRGKVQLKGVGTVVKRESRGMGFLGNGTCYLNSQTPDLKESRRFIKSDSIRALLNHPVPLLFE